MTMMTTATALDALYLTPKQLVTRLMESKGATPISFQAITEVKLRTGHPFNAPIVKVAQVNGFIGIHYENSVNNQREREGKERDFKAAGRRWGNRIHPCIIEHNGEFYLTVKVERSLGYKFVDNLGIQLTQAEVNNYLPKSGSSRQGVKTDVIYRDYKVTSIRDIRWNGQRIEIFNQTVD